MMKSPCREALPLRAGSFILKNQVIRNPHNMILRSNYECNENIFPIVTNIYDDIYD